MTRRSLPPKERLRLFTLHGGRCHLCGDPIDGTRERWEVEHVIPWALTRDDSDANRHPAHVSCHKVKSATDATDRAKAYRREQKHSGAHRSSRPMPGSRASGIRKRMDGTVERRRRPERGWLG